jgi:arylsulfatase A-like enzyme
MKYLVFFSSIVFFSSFSQAKKPNFVVIFMDDMGYGDLGCYGATKQKTPHLDQMAKDGIKLTSFYAAPVCSVSRAQLLTGCYGARISVPGVYGPGSPQGLNPSETTIAEHLKKLGYATQCIGKWHVGDQPDFLPTKQGFDHYLGIPYSNDMQGKPLDSDERVVPLLRDDKVERLLKDEDQRDIVEIYTQEAIQFIREKKDQPFFLYLPHTAIHTPIYESKKFSGTSQNGRVGDWIQEVDDSTGRILAVLKELKLEENTLVIFTSDNGHWESQGKDAGSAGPLRGAKGSTWEGGIRVPTIARWTGKIPAGTSNDAVLGTIDLLPTLVSLAGGTVPAEPVLDGRDASAQFLGKSKESPREAHYGFLQYQLQTVRQGPWKLALMPQNEAMSRPVKEDAQGKQPRLYNLDEEIGEKTDVSAKHPEVVAKLSALAETMNAQIGGHQPAARRPAGNVKNAKTLYPMQPRKKGQAPQKKETK